MRYGYNPSPEISFDEHGNCNHCNDSIRYIKNEMPSSQEKSEMIQEDVD